MGLLGLHETVESISASGKTKSRLPVDVILVSSFLAGAYIAFGAFIALMTSTGAPWPQGVPGLQKFTYAVVFPVGMVYSVIAGGELFTGNAMFMTVSYLRREIRLQDLARNWLLVWIGNFLGGIAVAYLFGRVGGILASEPWMTYLEALAGGKCSYTFTCAFWRGVGANWMGCLAVWMATKSHTIVDKAIACHLPIMTFVILGMENSVANMFTIPASLFVVGPTSVVTWKSFLLENLVPVSLGNLVGGAAFVGALYLYLSRRHEQLERAAHTG
ncbi:MAG TPA: formate/nitrite transporter family protein [Bacillota bacterium]|mgnify:CR=1 FL=1|jgi:formate/nitrite transporter|nr:formate/nitrite transporter family protein [Bacillota bacterium]HOJ58608.1 formate/nitrite transporter family protein [Bacillota bacterium]HOL02919.1 formate/nitrite transporter family protein [Bacillota bacterium]HPO80459.1 formate/nitrite transporter family protein [Bacillota bacterium]HPU62040.1 formate/nitrite transporter family protein [Bacillota bacterium]